MTQEFLNLDTQHTSSSLVMHQNWPVQIQPHSIPEKKFDRKIREVIMDLATRKKEQINRLCHSVNIVKANLSRIRSLVAGKNRSLLLLRKEMEILLRRERRHKFEPFYDGPFLVIKFHLGNTYNIVTPGVIIMANKYSGPSLLPNYHPEN